MDKRRFRGAVENDIAMPQAGQSPARFLFWHAWAPLFAFVVLAVVTMALNGDQWLADRIYAWGGQGWPLRDAFVTEHLVHVAGRNASVAAWLAVLAAWLVARVRPELMAWHRPLAFLLLAVLLSTGLVAWVKSWSNMDCPWDLVRYGGERPFVGLLQLRPVGIGRGVCFPAGHASGGYAWVALYFFLWMVRPQWRGWGLVAGLGLGLVFGFSQQLRGAHFLSHDVWTAGICWASSLLLFLAMRDPAASPRAVRPMLAAEAVTS